MKLNRYNRAIGCFLAIACLMPIAPAIARRVDRNATRIPVLDAQTLVEKWISSHRPHDGTYWHQHPELKEVTPADVWQRIGAQVFKLTDDTQSGEEVDAYLIRNRSVFPLSIGFGGYGLNSMCVCDLNRDGALELAYAYSWGSGMHRTELAVFLSNQASPDSTRSAFMYLGDLVLHEEADHRVGVYDASYESAGKLKQGELLGYLTMKSTSKRRVIGVEVLPGLPKVYRDRIWINTAREPNTSNTRTKSNSN